MKVFNPEDSSYIELSTQNEEELFNISCHSNTVHEYAKFTNMNYNIVERLEEQITKHGHLNFDSNSDISNLIKTQLAGFNMMSLFSLAKMKSLDNADKLSFTKKLLEAEYKLDRERCEVIKLDESLSAQALSQNEAVIEPLNK